MTGKPQHLAALEHANVVRIAISQLKREVRSGELPVGLALDDPRAAGMRIEDVLRAQPRWGRARANAVLRRAGVSEGRKVRELTQRQRLAIAHVVAMGSASPPPRPAPPQFPELADRDWLVRLYVTEGWNTAQIAAEVGCAPSTVITWLHSHGITVAAAAWRRTA